MTFTNIRKKESKKVKFCCAVRQNCAAALSCEPDKDDPTGGWPLCLQVLTPTSPVILYSVWAFSNHFRISGGPFSFCIHSQASQPPLLLAGIIRGYATLHQPAQLSYSSPQPSVTQSILSAFAKKVFCNFEETGGCEIPALVVYEGSRGEFSVSNSSRSAPIGRSVPCVPITNFPSQLLPSHNIWGKSRYLGRVHNFQFQLLI